MFKASLETRNYSFEAYGATKGDALGAMRYGIIVHAKQVGVSPGKLMADLWDDVETHEIDLLCCYRDNHKLVNPDRIKEN